MKYMAFLGIFALCALGTGSAYAQSCPTGTTRQTNATPANPGAGGGNFRDFISGATICASRGNDRWQEYHAANGDLIDWKLGANHAIDPTKKVGTWTSQNGADATVTHQYGNGSFVWAVCRSNATNGAPYTLVSPTGGTITGATIFSGQQACP